MATVIIWAGALDGGGGDGEKWPDSGEELLVSWM